MPQPIVPFCASQNHPPKISAGWGKTPTVTVGYQIAWADAFAFIDDALGNSTRADGTLTGLLLSTPWRYPGNERLWCIACDVDQVGTKIDAATLPQYQGIVPGEYWLESIAMVTFGVPDARDEQAAQPQYQFDPANPVTRCTCDVDWSAEHIQYDDGTFKWEAPGEPYDGEFVQWKHSRRVIKAGLTLDFPEVPFLPFTAIKAYLDSLNEFTSLGCGKGELLFDGGATRQSWDSAARITKSCKLKFTWRNRDQNEFLHRKGKWHKVKSDAVTDPYTYPYKDLNQIFR